MDNLEFAKKAKARMDATLDRYRNSIPRKAVKGMVAEIIWIAINHYEKEENYGKEDKLPEHPI